MICAMSDIVSRQLCLGRFEGSGTRWQRPHFAWSAIALDHASRLKSARPRKNPNFCGELASVVAWHDGHSLRRVLFLPFAASRYDSLKAKRDCSMAIAFGRGGEVSLGRINNPAPTSSPPTTMITAFRQIGRAHV